MTAPLPPYLDRIQTETRAARERLAGQVFDLKTVRSAIATAASAGQAVAVIRPPHPVDLRATDAAQAALKHLKDSGFKVGWAGYQEGWEGRPTDGWGLEIVWAF